MSRHPSFFRYPHLGAWRGFALEPIALVLATVLVWACVAYSTVTWVLRDSAGVKATVANTEEAVLTQDIDTQAVARVLGAQLPKATEAAPNAASRFQLVGVLNGDAQTSVALIAIDGQPAKPYRVGKAVSDGLVVQSTTSKRVHLGPAVNGPSTLSLELPAKK